MSGGNSPGRRLVPHMLPPQDTPRGVGGAARPVTALLIAGALLTVGTIWHGSAHTLVIVLGTGLLTAAFTSLLLVPPTLHRAPAVGAETAPVPAPTDGPRAATSRPRALDPLGEHAESHPPAHGRTPAEAEKIHTELPHDLVVAGVRAARWRIRLLAPSVTLLAEPHRAPFLTALSEALDRHVDIRILLQDPGHRSGDEAAPDAATAREIAQTLRELRALEESLTADEASLLDVRICPRLPPMSTYRWDDRAVSALAPPSLAPTRTRRASDPAPSTRYFETTADQGLAAAVDEQFDLLWAHAPTRPLAEYLHARLEISVGSGPRSAPGLLATARYVCVDGRIYVTASALTADLFANAAEPPVIRLVHELSPLGGDPDTRYRAVPVDTEHPVAAGIVEAFRRKYAAQTAVTDTRAVMARLDAQPRVVALPDDRPARQAARPAGPGQATGGRN